MSFSALYPLKFKPILKEKVWGGSKLKTLYNKEGGETLGESWELSGVTGNISEVNNGKLKGKKLNELIEHYTADLLGNKVYKAYGTNFPLLFKFIDAKQDLSVQLHPNDTLAKERHNSFGKTEMWYIMNAEENSRLILGFNREMDQSTYEEYLQNNNIMEILHSENVKKGDSFFIAPGTVHAIGAGVVLAEIQQTSDITYRIYDWDRPGTDGNMRELHTQEAIAAIDYNQPDAKLAYQHITNEAVLLKKSAYFETNRLSLTKQFKRDLSIIDSFVVYMCVAGNGTIEVDDFSETISTGETVLIPANFKELTIKTQNATVLEVYIP
ncbi:type I phosphomannose isomerase catalytic subunit [Patiriisocius hiemis]|uniref:Phosphohexomutase n=1 Tax=Patiriisocius hiemis TaxID=3075604 RepID=A0ABU2Y858_9FLAO|nr:type I phosphomannose isomerase catalytic subunit [Constantimarinum sp. W242]MDT0554373.1 type I phosphomannose isomerase catalytic subunit [Constantimarinum sp. W242]